MSRGPGVGTAGLGLGVAVGGVVGGGVDVQVEVGSTGVAAEVGSGSMITRSI